MDHEPDFAAAMYAEHRRIHGHDFDPIYEGERYPPCRHPRCVEEGRRWALKLTDTFERAAV